VSNSAAGGVGALRRDLKRLRGCGETASEGTARAGRARRPPASSPCAALELVSRFELTMRAMREETV
jgi:hypothetical protein